MASLVHDRIRYEVHGPAKGPAYVLVNGLTQYLEVWQPYWDALAAKGFRVAVFDLLGQGVSDKPSLFIDQDEQVAVLHDLITELGQGPIFLAGISFGGAIALRYAVTHGDTIAGLVPISAFAELSPQLSPRQGHADHPDPERNEFSHGLVVSDESFGCMAWAAPRHVGSFQTAGMVVKRHLRAAEPDGFIFRLGATDFATVIDPHPDNDPERRI